MMKIFILSVLLASSVGCWADEGVTNDGEEYVDSLAMRHPEYLPQIAVGSVAPEFSAPDGTGKMVKLSDFRGKYVVIDFWASWCGDCRRETPGFKRLYEEMKDVRIDGAEVQFLSYSFDRDETRWKSFVEDEGLVWPQVSTLQAKWHDIPVTKDYGLSWIPAFVLVSPDGRVVGKAITAEGISRVARSEKEKSRQRREVKK